MSVRLPWQTQSSVISAGFKPSPETHMAVMVHGRKKKGRLVVAYNMCYLCTTMGVVKPCLVTLFPFTRSVSAEEVGQTFPNYSEPCMIMWVNRRLTSVALRKCSFDTGTVSKHPPTHTLLCIVYDRWEKIICHFQTMKRNMHFCGNTVCCVCEKGSYRTIAHFRFSRWLFNSLGFILIKNSAPTPQIDWWREWGKNCKQFITRENISSWL